MVIGITGGSGSGKSSVVSELEKDGFYVIDADEVARFVVRIDMPAYNEIREYFGKDVFFKNGELNRKKLGEIVFSDKEKLEKLNKITHKHIYKEIKKRIENNKDRNIVIDAALLKKGGLMEFCEVSVAIVADKDARIERIMNRDNLSYEAAKNRINSQVSDDTYKEYCDFVFDNSKGKDIKSLKNEVMLCINGFLNKE